MEIVNLCQKIGRKQALDLIINSELSGDVYYKNREGEYCPIGTLLKHVGLIDDNVYEQFSFPGTNQSEITLAMFKLRTNKLFGLTEQELSLIQRVHDGYYGNGIDGTVSRTKRICKQLLEKKEM